MSFDSNLSTRRPGFFGNLLKFLKKIGSFRMNCLPSLIYHFCGYPYMLSQKGKHLGQRTSPQGYS